MFEIIQSDEFAIWLRDLKDSHARARIHTRLERMADGNLGDVKPVGEGIREARITYGPGYRLYFIQRGMTIMVMLAGGDKSTQSKDILKAKEIAHKWR